MIINEWHELVTAFSLKDATLVRTNNASYIVKHDKTEKINEFDDTRIADTGKTDTEPT